MEDGETIENFFGVYLLYCNNPKYKGRTYVGYTVNPNRRIEQHNAGSRFGGAWKTSNRGPWTMVLIIHGFPTAISALRFEWAWQHPESSRRLKNAPKKRSKEKVFDYKLTLLCEMLRLCPWRRLPLKIRWLDEEFGLEYSNRISPPMHMSILYGKVVFEKSKKRKNENIKTTDPRITACTICKLIVESEERITCVKDDCVLEAHLICLAELFCAESAAILPIEGSCPACDTNVLWGDLIKKFKCKLPTGNK